MNYLSKPITGLTTKISQLFSGRVKPFMIHASRLTNKVPNV